MQAITVICRGTAPQLRGLPRCSPQEQSRKLPPIRASLVPIAATAADRRIPSTESSARSLAQPSCPHTSSPPEAAFVTHAFVDGQHVVIAKPLADHEQHTVSLTFLTGESSGSGAFLPPAQRCAPSGRIGLWPVLAAVQFHRSFKILADRCLDIRERLVRLCSACLASV